MSTLASAPAIETAGLTKFYGDSRGIEDLDLRVERGEVFGYLGSNGAGKTTTIRLLLDLIRPTRGRATICGLDTRRQSLEARRLTGYLPGELKLPERSAVLDFLAFLGALRGGVERKAIAELAERLGLPLERRIGDLSRGNKQKVGVVAAFMHDPEVLILDEPTSGLDPLRQHDVLELIRERAAAGRTVFFSSHELDQVEHVAGRVGIVRAGRLVAVEAISTLRERALRRVEVRLAAPADVSALRAVPGVRGLTSRDGVVRLDVEGSMDALVKELARLPVQTLTSEAPELEDVFRSYYGGDDGG
ncbi:MAG TPA: ABC transporter ATP-binding protein [Gaiellaceae bacterium]|nr:ABC transporter ATP-binding protein [Gaiellaceae bacterium]